MTLAGANVSVLVIPPPTISPVSPPSVNDGSVLSFAVGGQSPDGDPVTYSLAAGAPPGAAIDPQTGQFTWNLSEANGLTPGDYPATVIVTDAMTQQSTSTTFNVTVGPSSTDQGSGMAARQATALGLTQSTEYYTNFIVAAYNKYLGRGPDAVGLAYWLNLMQNQRLSDERLEAGFIGSTEYINDHDGAGAGWIKGMYENLLGRTPAAWEVQYWSDQLAAGESTTDIAYGFAASQERETQRVTADYQQYLGRGARPDEVQYWVNVFENGGSNEEVIAGFISSQEYFQDHGNNVVDWLYACYRAVLHRQPDAVALAYWENQLG